MVQAYSVYGGELRRIKVYLEKPEGKSSLGRPSRRCEHNSKMDLHEAGYEDKDEIDVAQDRGSWQALVSAALKLWVS